MKSVVVIGGGFAGLSSACYLAKAGYKVTLLEKNSWLGGRAQVWESEGFHFDMGPSFYWMPEVFERFFGDFGKTPRDYYKLERLNPGYTCVFEGQEIVSISDDFQAIKDVFESIEEGAGAALDDFIENCKQKYNLSMDGFIYDQFSTILDFINIKLLTIAPKLEILKTYTGLVRKHFASPKIRAIMEYPTVFLGAPGNRIPGTYTLMNYVDFILGTWYPTGGFSRVSESMAELAVELGVTILKNQEVEHFAFEDKKNTSKITSVTTVNGQNYEGDIIVSASPYHHIESLLPPALQQYTPAYWDSRVLSPSALNFYIGLSRTLPNLTHHTFFFDADWETHFADTYSEKTQWQKDPLFYVHVPSKTDPNVAPQGHEALYILIPVAAGLADTNETRLRLYTTVLQRISTVVGFDISEFIVTERSYAHNEFVSDYHALKGSAFGLGHTLFQTASFRPRNKSKKVSNLYFTGQDTIPGTSTVMSVISGKVTSEKIVKDK